MILYQRISALVLASLLLWIILMMVLPFVTDGFFTQLPVQSRSSA